MTPIGQRFPRDRPGIGLYDDVGPGGGQRDRRQQYQSTAVRCGAGMASARLIAASATSAITA